MENDHSDLPPGPIVPPKGWASRLLGSKRRLAARAAGFLALSLLWAWWNWDEIRTNRVIGTLVDSWLHDPLPPADPEKFSVGVVHLKGDDGATENFVVSSLASLEGVQVLRYDRSISVKATKQQEADQQGHEEAVQLLMESGATVLLWGQVVGPNRPRLFWTVATGFETALFNDN